MLTIDISKAFDSVSHKVLIERMKEIKIEGTELNVFVDFLSERSQFVEINGVKSTQLRLKSGKAQGSKIAATLFIIFINGVLKQNLLYGKAQYFADDGAYLYSTHSFENLISQIRNDIGILDSWFNKNLLKLNLNKTKFIVFDNNKISISSTLELSRIIISGVEIERVNAIKYLGLIIDSRLNWCDHIDAIKSKLYPIMFAIYRARKFLHKKCLWQLYYAHFLSHIQYLNPIWNMAPEYKIKEIQRLQNRAIKTIEFLPRLTPTIDLYLTRLNIQKFSKYMTILTVFKIKHNLIRHSFKMTFINDIHQYNTRNERDFRIEFCRTSRSAGSIMINGLSHFNNLPVHLKNENRINVFARELRLLLLSTD